MLKLLKEGVKKDKALMRTAVRLGFDEGKWDMLRSIKTLCKW